MPSECITTLTRGCAFAAACVAAAACAPTAPERVADRPCPDRPAAVYAAFDVSDTGRSPQLVAERLAAARELLTGVAVCRGHVRVVAFTGSAAATDVLLDRDLLPDGATRRAQLRRVPKLVDAAMDEVRSRLDGAADRLPAGGTDVLAQLGLAREFHQRVGTDRPLQVVIWSDGIATAPIDFSSEAELEPARGEALARQVVPADLADADVTFSGVGRPAFGTPPTAFVDGLKAFYLAVCERAHANCAVVTQ